MRKDIMDKLFELTEEEKEIRDRVNELYNKIIDIYYDYSDL